MKSRWFTIGLVVFCLAGFGADRPEPDWNAILAKLKSQFAPDRRLAVFDMSVEQGREGLVVKGQVDCPEAKRATLAAVQEAAGVKPIARIAVLPDPRLGAKRYGIVAASVVNVRAKPDHPAEMLTQAGMGMVVRLLKTESTWCYVQLPDRYHGWLEAKSMHLASEETVKAWREAPKMIVTDWVTTVRLKPSADALPVCDAVACNLLKYVGREGSWTAVETPDGRRGFLESTKVDELDHWRRTRRLTPENLELTGRKLMGIPYLWGGTSPKGLDCSGFTTTVYRLNGFELLRDASQQIRLGEEISLDDDYAHLRKGDLLLFGEKATAKRPELITHVAMYLQDKEYIHSPGGGWICIESLDRASPLFNAVRQRELLHARRVLGIPPVPGVTTYGW